MPPLPKTVCEAWNNYEGPMILATVNADKIPNTIYINCVKKLNEEKIAIADYSLVKTNTNILAGSKGSLLFITQKHHAFQIKGFFEYHTNGDIYEDMCNSVKNVIPFKLQGVAVLNVEEAYSGSQKLL